MPRRIVDVAPCPLERDPGNPDPNAFTAGNGRWIIRRCVMVIDDPLDISGGRPGIRTGDETWIVWDARGEHGRGYPWTFATIGQVLRHIPRTIRFTAGPVTYRGATVHRRSAA